MAGSPESCCTLIRWSGSRVPRSVDKATSTQTGRFESPIALSLDVGWDEDCSLDAVRKSENRVVGQHIGASTLIYLNVMHSVDCPGFMMLSLGSGRGWCRYSISCFGSLCNKKPPVRLTQVAFLFDGT